MKHGTARRVMGVALTGLLALGLAACGGGTQPSGSGTPGTGGDAAANATAWALTGGSEEAFRASFERWNSANPDAKVEAEWFANDAFKEKIRTSVGSGNAPTLIFSWAGGTLADYVANGAVADISGDVAALKDKVLPSVLANGQIDGKTYAVPNNQSQPVVLFYNKEVLNQAGVAAVPATYEELLSAVDKLKAAGVTPIALAGQSKWPELMYIQYLTDRVGGPEVFQRILDGEADAWSDPAITEALTKIQELVEVGAFGNAFGSVAADGGADTALVHTGKAAMILQGAWVFPDFLNNAADFVSAGNLGFANFPAVGGGKGDASNIVGNPANFWSVSAKAPAGAQKTATSYLSAEIYSDAMVDDLLAVGAVPPVVGLEDKIAKADNPEFLGFVYSMVKDAGHFQLSWDQALPADQGQALLDNLAAIFLGQSTPEQFVTAMNATLK